MITNRATADAAHEIARKIAGDERSVARRHASMASRTTSRTGGEAECLVEAATTSTLRTVVAVARDADAPLTVLGNGSNLICSQRRLRGVVVVLRGEFGTVRVDGDEVDAGAAANLPQLVARLARAGLAGAENLAGIPATVGGAIAMNCGTAYGCIGQQIVAVRYLNDCGEIEERRRSELEFAYRRGPVRRGVIVGARLRFKRSSAAECIARLHARLEERRRTQPVSAASAGCFFRNPPGLHARELIAAAGLAGMRIGGAVVSTLHANFLVNEGTATGEDFLALGNYVAGVIYRTTGIALEREIHLLGFDRETC